MPHVKTQNKTSTLKTNISQNRSLKVNEIVSTCIKCLRCGERVPYSTCSSKFLGSKRHPLRQSLTFRASSARTLAEENTFTTSTTREWWGLSISNLYTILLHVPLDNSHSALPRWRQDEELHIMFQGTASTQALSSALLANTNASQLDRIHCTMYISLEF